jgi:hypothetical protein
MGFVAWAAIYTAICVLFYVVLIWRSVPEDPATRQPNALDADDQRWRISDILQDAAGSRINRLPR